MNKLDFKFLTKATAASIAETASSCSLTLRAYSAA